MAEIWGQCQHCEVPLYEEPKNPLIADDGQPLYLCEKCRTKATETPKKTYAVVLIEIDTDSTALGVDRFHRWRRFVNRPSNQRKYGVKVINWRIPSKVGFKDA